MMSRAGMHALLAQSAQELSPWLLVAAAGAVVLILLLLAAPLLRKRGNEATPPSPAAPPAVRAASSASGEHRALERDIQILIKELSDLTRRVNAQIAQVDERSARLEQLLRAADERAARLVSTNGDSNGDGLSTPVVPTTTTMTTGTSITTTTSSPDEIDPRHVEIYTLCEQGLSTQQIADRLHRPSGEVELIIALRPRKHALGASRE